MRRTLIAATAIQAARFATGMEPLSKAGCFQFMQLYDYGHERGWPSVETLTRKAVEIAGISPPAWLSQMMQVGLSTFRAVGLALDPFYEADQAGDPTWDQVLFPEPTLPPDALLHASVHKAVNETMDELGLENIDELFDMAVVGRFMAIHHADELEAIRAAMLESLNPPGEPDMDPNSVEARTKAAQAAMDEEIAQATGGENGSVATDPDETADAAAAAADAPADPAAAPPAKAGAATSRKRK